MLSVEHAYVASTLCSLFMWCPISVAHARPLNLLAPVQVVPEVVARVHALLPPDWDWNGAGGKPGRA